MPWPKLWHQRLHTAKICRVFFCIYFLLPQRACISNTPVIVCTFKAGRLHTKTIIQKFYSLYYRCTFVYPKYGVVAVSHITPSVQTSPGIHYCILCKLQIVNETQPKYSSTARIAVGWQLAVAQQKLYQGILHLLIRNAFTLCTAQLNGKCYTLKTQ